MRACYGGGVVALNLDFSKCNKGVSIMSALGKKMAFACVMMVRHLIGGGKFFRASIW